MSKDLYSSSWNKGFSFKNGIKEIKKEKQKDNLNEKTRIRILNLFSKYFEEAPTEEFIPTGYDFDFQRKFITCFVEKFYIIESYKYANSLYFPNIARRTLIKSDWYDVFDFIEFWIYINLKLLKEYKKIIDKFNDDNSLNISLPNFLKFKDLSKMINDIFKEEFVSYRIIDQYIIPVDNDVEICSIKRSIDSPYEEVSRHMQKALIHLSNREKLDYANSIKESISSVEAMVSIISGDEKATLGKALKNLKAQGIYIHKSLENAFNSLYGYTSDSSGIRHSFKSDDKEATLEEAKFMLVACSAFNNYLLDNSSKN